MLEQGPILHSFRCVTLQSPISSEMALQPVTALYLEAPLN